MIMAVIPDDELVYGEWRAVPGVDGIFVSSEGYITTCDVERSCPKSAFSAVTIAYRVHTVFFTKTKALSHSPPRARA